jgi:hypothetical protein
MTSTGRKWPAPAYQWHPDMIADFSFPEIQYPHPRPGFLPLPRNRQCAGHGWQGLRRLRIETRHGGGYVAGCVTHFYNTALP